MYRVRTAKYLREGLEVEYQHIWYSARGKDTDQLRKHKLDNKGCVDMKAIAFSISKLDSHPLQ